jgi:hypothetical protein
MSTSASVPLLFQLPDALFVALVSEWLDMPSIGKLDTAILSKALRQQFLFSLQNMRSTSVDDHSSDRGIGFLGGDGEWTGYWWRWLSIRQIYIERIALRGKDIRWELVIPSLLNVSIDDCEDDDLRYLVRNCPSLRCLGIVTEDSNDYPLVSDAGLEVLADLRESLEEFSYCCSTKGLDQEYHSRSAAALVDVFRQCSNLVKVSLTDYALHSVNFEELIPFVLRIGV